MQFFCLSLPLLPFFSFCLYIFFLTNTKLAVFRKQNKTERFFAQQQIITRREKNVVSIRIGTFFPNNCFMDACVVEYTIRMRLFWVVQFCSVAACRRCRERAWWGRQFWYLFCLRWKLFSLLLFCFDDCVHRTSTSFNEFVMRKVGHGVFA